MSQAPAIEGWFTDGPEPALLGSRCTTCASVFFPPTAGFCRNPACAGEEFFVGRAHADDVIQN